MTMNNDNPQSPLDSNDYYPWMQTAEGAMTKLTAWLGSLEGLSPFELSQKVKEPGMEDWLLDLRLTGHYQCWEAVVDFVTKNPYGIVPVERATGLLYSIAGNARLSPQLITSLLDMSASYDLELEAPLAGCHNILTHHVSELTNLATRFIAAGKGEGEEILLTLVHNPGLTDVGLTMLASASQNNDSVLSRILSHRSATEMVHRFVPENLVQAHLAEQAQHSIAINQADGFDLVWNSFEAGRTVHTDFAAIYNPETPAWVLDDLLHSSGIRQAVLNLLVTDNFYACLSDDDTEEDLDNDDYLEL